ncbi:hypothetical protein GW950_02075 [Candidatus Wolfebacteria bacterium]|nr:hypothetical protein [Candidatus Wolfebacteria bacterium]
MDILIRLFDLFNATARSLAVYVPQSGDDLIVLLKKILNFVEGLNNWIFNNLGISFQSIARGAGKLIIIWITFIFEILKGLVERL